MTTLIALGVLVVWWVPVFMKRSLGVYTFLSCQTLIAIGFTLEFVLPGIYFDFFPWNPQGYADLTPFYPMVMLMALIAGIPFFFLSILDRRRNKFKKVYPAKNFPPDVITKGQKIPFPIAALIAVIFIGGLVGKYYMIKTGSFYHTFRTSYEYESFEKFVIITILSDYFVISGLFLLAIGWKKRQFKYRWIGYITLGIELIFGIISGKRSFVGQLIIQYFTLRIACNRIPRMLTFTIICLLFLLMLPIMEIYSGYTAKANISESTLLTVEGSYHLYKYSIKEVSYFLPKIMFRLGTIRGAAAVYSVTPDVVDYQYGRTYAYMPCFIIPRIIWPDKPNIPQELATYTKIALPLDPGSNGASWVGESYINFSWFGVFFIGCVLALLTRKFDNWLIPRAKSYIFFAVIWAYFSFNVICVSKSLSHLIPELLRIFIYFCPFYKISGKPESRVKNARLAKGLFRGK